MTTYSEVLRCEERFWRSMQDRDLEAALELVDDTCIVTGAQGVARIDKKTFAKLMVDGAWTLRRFAISDANVESPADGVAVIGYRVREDLVVDGKPLMLEAADASTWVRRKGNCVCILHTESVLGDPFGRDRIPETAKVDLSTT